ncbi:MAG: hypothetical protein MJ236_04920 [Clostridia bacterium]|nr:hypothetical protein [Clostridia bacterium]
MLELIMASRIYDYGYYGAGMYGLAGEYLTTGTNSLSSAANKWVARTLNPLISNFVSALDKTN